jgi:alpha-galactosidase
MAGPWGFLLHLYYGRRIAANQDMSYLIRRRDRGFSGNPADAGADRGFSPDTLPLEYPTTGTGDYRTAAAGVINADGSFVLDPRFQRCEIKKGKYTLPGLPALYEDENGGAETLAVTLLDSVSKLEITLLYGVFAEKDIITRAAVFTNRGGGGIKLVKAMSASVDFLSGEFDLIHFHGRHAMERQVERIPAMHGIQRVSSRRGTSSHQHNPGIILCAKDAAEDHGACYGFNLVYSGSFSADIETDQIGQTRVNMGLDYDGFCWTLAEGESFATPELVMCYSDEGFAALSHRFHRIYRHNLCRGPYRLAPRPVLINNWEATYFDFTGAKLIEIARDAAKLGLDMLVMDDGWFGRPDRGSARDSDDSALGDWFVNENKLRMSLAALVGEINRLGVKFGLWFEPEMINEDSVLYREHPDWALRIPGRQPVRSRNQLVLDMSREDVRDYLYSRICAILDSANIEYVKWDMNRSIVDWHSPFLSAGRQGELPHRYMLGLYELLEKLTQKYPHVLFEGCSGGGGRFDPGMLYYHPQIWCSDNTDAINRLKIQYGTSFFYPASSTGSHVSAVPNHQTGRTAPLKTRCIAAMPGSFGFEMDLTAMSNSEKQTVQVYIREFKKYQNLIHDGLYFRLTNPFEKPFAAWQFVSPDKTKALLCAVLVDSQANPLNLIIRLKGLDEEKTYRLGEQSFTGAALMYGGFTLPDMAGDYPSEIFYFEEKQA